MSDDSKKTLMKRLGKLEESLHIERLRLHRVIDNTGWGPGCAALKLLLLFVKKAS